MAILRRSLSGGKLPSKAGLLQRSRAGVRWLIPREDVDDPTPIDELTDAISADQEIPLEHEDDFEWVAFIPAADGQKGVLTR